MNVNRRDFCRLSGLSLGAGLLTPSLMFSPFTNASTVKPPYRMKKLVHGVAYYPELWPLENVDNDIKRMKELGINVARMAEFAWSVMETERGEYDFSLFRGVMDKMHAAGIDVVLCTPTATPPIWLTHNHPERLLVNADGETMSHGARQHASYEHPEVRKACFKIIDEMAKALGDHPALIAWQIDNEMKAHVAEDFSEAAVKNWHLWLKNRFGTIEKLNQAWGTHTWSTHYLAFEQVPAPVKTPFLHSASLSTAYRMFNRESIANFMVAQRDVIRKHSSQPVTHNDNPAFNIHHEKSMEAQDFASYDAYPSFKQWGALAFRSDMYRAAIPGRPFWIMETSVAHNGWLGNHHVPHPNGFLAAEAILTYALGGEGFCYWLWRQQRAGAELPHSAVISAWNQPSIGYKEVEKVNRARLVLEPFLINSRIKPAEAAVTYSDHARAMIETEPMDKREGFPNRYRGVIEKWQNRLLNLGIHRDVRFENAKLDGLKLLLTPAMPYVSEAFLTRVYDFVEKGGIWIAGPVTGTRAEEHTLPTNAGLGLLDSFAGIETKYVVPLTNTEAKGTAFSSEAPLSGWCAAMEPKPGTKVIGTIDSGIASGLAFMTERSIGKGKVVMLGAQPHGEDGEKMLDSVLSHYANEAKISDRFKADKGIVVAKHIQNDGKEYMIAINMEVNTGELEVPEGAIDAITQEPINSTKISIPSYEYRIIYPHST